MTRFPLFRWIVAGAAAVVAVAVAPEPVLAVGPEPAAPPKRCAQHAEGSAAWKQCMRPRKGKAKGKQKSRLDDNETYALGYWLAVTGEHRQALDVLRSARNASHPHVQTMIGFSLRRMGKVDEAMAYYAAALSADPRLTSTRQYLGEAYLQKGERTKAEEQLAEIARICGGTSCEHYRLLAELIEKVG